MPITPFLRDEAFDPEAVEAMARAFLAACRALGLADRGDPLNEIVAKHLINTEQLLPRCECGCIVKAGRHD